MTDEWDEKAWSLVQRVLAARKPGESLYNHVGIFAAALRELATAIAQARYYQELAEAERDAAYQMAQEERAANLKAEKKLETERDAALAEVTKLQADVEHLSEALEASRG